MIDTTDLQALDRNIATTVMGWHSVGGVAIAKWVNATNTASYGYVDEWRPTRDGNAMLAVIERMRELGYLLSVDHEAAYSRDSDGGIVANWIAYFRQPWEGVLLPQGFPALPHAIALAALAALGGKDAE